MSQSPETMVFEWKKVTDPELAAQAAVALHKEGANINGGIYAIPSQQIAGGPAGEFIKRILTQIPNIESFDYNNSGHIDTFVEALVELAEDATIRRYGITQYIEEEFTVTDRLSFYASRETLTNAGFTFDDEKGTATPPASAPLPPAR